jgi:hypothetical protein
MPAANTAIIFFIKKVQLTETARKINTPAKACKPFVKDFTKSPVDGEWLAKSGLLFG